MSIYSTTHRMTNEQKKYYDLGYYMGSEDKRKELQQPPRPIEQADNGQRLAKEPVPPTDGWSPIDVGLSIAISVQVQQVVQELVEKALATQKKELLEKAVVLAKSKLGLPPTAETRPSLDATALTLGEFRALLTNGDDHE